MDILERFFPRVSCLEDFLRDLNGCPPLCIPKDKAGYRAFLQSTLVGIPSCHINYQGPLDYTQHSDHMEVINRVLLRLQHQGKGGKNVLLNGFTSWRSEGDYAGIPPSINVPNNNSNQLRIPFWSKLLSRIGDELMMHILENLSIFAAAPPSCYIQLTGTPLSMLISSLPTNTPSPAKTSTVEQRSKQRRKSFQLKDAAKGGKVDRCDGEGRKVQGKRKRDEDGGCNQEDANVAKFRKGEQGMRQPTQRKEAENREESKEDPKVLESMITGLERSYYILNACYSRTVGRTLLKHDLISKLPASNSGAQMLTQHIFNSPGKYDKTISHDGKGKGEIGMQGDDKGRKKKKLQRTCRRLIKVQALLKTFLTQHRKLKLNSILNHQCPLNLPQDGPPSDHTNNNHQEGSTGKQGQRSHTKKTSLSPPCAGEGASREKSLAELREESMLEGYSPKVFQRKRPKQSVLKNTQVSSVEQFDGTRMEDESVIQVDDGRGGVEQRRKDDGRKGSTKKVGEGIRDGLRDRVGLGGTEERVGNDRRKRIGEVEPMVKSTNIQSTTNERRSDEKNGDSISVPQSLSVRMEMDEIATSSTVGDALQETDSIPSQPHMRLRRKTNTETETWVGLPSGTVSVDNDDDGALTVSGKILSQPDKRLRGKTNMRTKTRTPLIDDGVLKGSQPDRKAQRKTKTGGQLPTCTSAPNDDANRGVILDSMQSQLKRKMKKTTDTKAKPRMRLPNDAATLIKMKTDPWQVCLFLRQVLLKVIPDELWGSVHNRNVFLKGVKKFVQLGRFERLSLRELTEEIRAEDCDWCQLEKFRGRDPPFTSVVKQRQLVTDFFHWLMVGYAVPLIMMCFYVTETSSSRNQLIFYRKPVWLLLEKIGIQYYVAHGIMKPMKENDVKKLVSAGLTLGFSRLRFVPKTKSLRPITRMGKSVIEEKKGLSVRLLLQDLFDVLTYHKINQPSVMGSSLLGIDGIYHKVLKFIKDRKERKDTRPLYFVKIDIEKCYDSIKHSKLLQIISMLLQGHDKPDEYQLQRYVTVTRAASAPTGLQKRSHRHVTTELSSFHRQLIQMAQHGKIKNAIIINQVHTVKVTPKDLLQRLKQHVMADVVKSGRKYYWRQDGISQGSILSSLLCSFFYAHLERCYLSDIVQEGLMMRLIDDFLLITPHHDKAQRFLQLLLSGVKQYGCSANPSKTLANFDFMHDGQLVPRSKELFPWCGIVFKTQTLNISNDYTKYNNVSIRYTLTICTDRDTSLHLMRIKLTWSLKAKNVSIFMDPLINSFLTIVINVYHLLLLLAHRFHSYYHCLASYIKQNTPPLQFYNIWASCVRIFHACTVSKLRKDDQGERETTFPLTINTVNWIGLKAFDTKLGKHKGLYHPLIKLVRKHRQKAALKMGKAMLEVLEEMTNPALPDDFMKMRR
uniref:Telomerase reverse transcriptase n=1 Tax=Strongylocentrotus purpuratus TaxID=7668 RepID=B8YR06_STRPU|nr:telomerase reverse transcriptase-long isoform 1 [Strongylocentrotus purpuratus]ACL80758.1 telomerase reverse transcriptase [Strongylocentrotus purpuratus]